MASEQSEEQPSCSKNVNRRCGKYCCIPECKNSSRNEGQQTGISLFQIPTKEPDRTRWIKILNRYRRKGSSDSFDPRKKIYYVCEDHFKEGDLKKTFGSSGRKRVRDNKFPTIFAFKQVLSKRKRRSPRKRQQIIESSSESIIESDSEEIIDNQPNFDDEVPPLPVSELDLLRQEITELNMKLQKSEQLVLKLQEQNQMLQNQMFNYKNVSKDEEIFRKTTGIKLNSFQSLIKYVNPGKKCSNIKYYDTSKRLSNDSMVQEECLKAGPVPKLNANDQLLLYLSWLKNGFTLNHVSLLFNISVSTVSRYIITWSNLLYFSLGAIPIWPTRAQVDAHMPKSFKELYPCTRCIIDCTELYCQRPSSLATQSSLYSHYKSRVTYKGLVGISPSGAITFISQLYDGSISDKAIVRQSGFLQEHFWEKDDSVMADRGFTIEDDLKPFNVKLNIPAFLDNRDQLSHEEIKESQTIASVRIHVERAIRRIKKFKAIRNEIPLTLHGSINQIWTVACLLCNFLPPLIAQ